MSPLTGVSTQNVKRLLELFPISVLRQVWNLKGTKEEVCHTVAEQQPAEQIIEFVDTHVSCCKQHNHIFERANQNIALPATLAGIAPAKVTADYALYILRSEYSVVLKDPYEDATLEFLWPVRVEATPHHVIARFVVLEKNLGSYFERPYLLNERSADEKDVVRELGQVLGLAPSDLHTGVKRLWVDNFMDSSRARYKRPQSLAYEAMDEERGIKEHDPELYERLLDSVLFSTLFIINTEHERARDLTVAVVSIDPSTGYIAFPRYTDRVGDTERVIREILTNNQ
jgi:hypothetical protein